MNNIQKIRRSLLSLASILTPEEHNAAIITGTGKGVTHLHLYGDPTEMTGCLTKALRCVIASEPDPKRRLTLASAACNGIMGGIHGAAENEEEPHA